MTDNAGVQITVQGGGSGRPYKLGETVGEEYFLFMNGREVFKHAVRNMTAVCEALLAKNGLGTDDIDLFIPHQANLRIMEAVAKKLALPEDKVVSTIERYGNTSASTVGIALAELKAAGRLVPGCRVLFGVFGGGFTWGSALVRF